MPHLDLPHLAAIARAVVSDFFDDEYMLAEESLSSGSAQGISRRAHNWVLRLRDYERFWLEHDRAPRENTRDRSALPAPERRLGQWARYQRRFEHDLTDYQRYRLDISPAFSWDPRKTRWQRNYDACVEHVSRTNRLPALTASNRSEFVLARWLGRQLQAVQNRRLAEPRLTALNSLLAIQKPLATNRGDGAWLPHQTKNAESST